MDSLVENNEIKDIRILLIDLIILIKDLSTRHFNLQNSILKLLNELNDRHRKYRI